jgi:hypothetical protein
VGQANTVSLWCVAGSVVPDDSRTMRAARVLTQQGRLSALPTPDSAAAVDARMDALSLVHVLPAFMYCAATGKYTGGRATGGARGAVAAIVG